jgi:multicomponent Na+:H+ antiporter subunit D
MSAAGIASMLPLPVLAPICGAALSPLVARVDQRLALVIGIVAMGAATGFLVLIATQVYSGHGSLLVHFFSNQHPQHGASLGISFAADPFGTAIAILTAGLGLFLLVSILSELGHLGSHEIGGLACLVQLLLAAVIAAALTADTINLFVWFQVAALSSYGLTGFFLERPIALEAAFKLVVLTTIASFAVFIGSAMLYARTGALNFGQLHNALDQHAGGPEFVALALLLAGYGTKAGVMPFHGWLPDAHTPVPGAVSALFSALMVDLGILGIVRMSLQVFGPDPGHHVLGLLTGIGITSAIAGAALALVQDDLKRLLAWDTVSQMGIILVGFASSSLEGVGGAAYHLINHGLFKGLLFLCAGAVVHATGKTELRDMGGLIRTRPVLAVGFTIGAVAIAGVPPMNGYASLGVLHEGLKEGEPAIYVLALIAQVLTVAALSRATYLGFYRRRDEPYEHLEPARTGMRVSIFTVGAACIALGVFPGLVLRKIIGPAAQVLLHSSDYANGVLSAGLALRPVSLTFDYIKPEDLILVAIEVALGLALAATVLRWPDPLPFRLLRRLHTGSVNDYAAFSVAGLIVTAAALLS